MSYKHTKSNSNLNNIVFSYVKSIKIFDLQIHFVHIHTNHTKHMCPLHDLQLYKCTYYILQYFKVIYVLNVKIILCRSVT